MRQIVRYGIVGAATNLGGYLLYLLVTWAGVPPKIAMTCLYALGTAASFLGNRRFTFSHRGSVAASAVRFAIAYLLGYLVNLALMLVFVDRLGYPHQLVQGAALFIVAGFLFVLLRVFVFPAGRPA